MECEAIIALREKAVNLVKGSVFDIKIWIICQILKDILEVAGLICKNLFSRFVSERMRKMYTILIVDDKEVFRRKLKRMAYFRENSGKFCIAYEAQNGIEAMKVLENNRVDVVLTDIRMPFIDGIELLKRINEKNLCGCVLLLSEFADFNYAKAGILNGAFDYILKPVDEEKIREAFERVYSYMNSVSKTEKAEKPEVDLLAEFILSGNRMNVITCSNKVINGIRNSHPNRDEFGLQMVVITDYLRKKITERLPYLDLYISFPDREQSSGWNAESSAEDFSSRMQELTDTVQLLSVPDGSAQVRQACRMILDDPHGQNSIGSIAERLFTTKKYLSALMKKETGRSAVKYITQIKIERAKKLIRDSGMRVGEISEMLGFADSDYFSKVFKKMTGLSPREYREAYDERRTETR